LSEIEQSDDILLTEDQVNYVLRFAESLMGNNLSPYGSALNPMMLNQRMKDVTLNPLQATENSLNTALQHPKTSELQLQAFSQDFEIQSQIYRKLLDYSGHMLSFDMTYSSDAKATDYKGKAYQNDLDKLKQFVDKFDYKNEFSTVVQEMLRNEAYFCAPRMDGEQIVLQELPASPVYTMITGRWDRGLLFSMNLYWFLQPGVDLDMYPPFFTESYRKLWEGGSVPKKYMPEIAPDLRGNSSWVYWQDIPVDVGWCWKLSPAMATRVPFYSGLFLDLIMQPQMRALQRNMNMAAAAKIVIGEIPLLNKTTQAGTKDQFSISAKNLGEFLSLVKSAIGEAIKTAAVPLTNIQGVDFPSQLDLYQSYLKTALATSGVNTNLIFTSDVRPNSIESQLSLNVDEAQMTALYPQFEQFMNYQVNKMTKKFKFKIRFEGTHFFNNRQQRFDKQMQLSGLGIVLPQKIAASIGMNPFEFQSQLEESQGTDWVSKLTPIISGFQQSGKGDSAEGSAGRPKKTDNELSDSGEQTRSDASNVGRGGK
jgi:hypothetical protein